MTWWTHNHRPFSQNNWGNLVVSKEFKGKWTWGNTLSVKSAQWPIKVSAAWRVCVTQTPRKDVSNLLILLFGSRNIKQTMHLCWGQLWIPTDVCLCQSVMMRSECTWHCGSRRGFYDGREPSGGQRPPEKTDVVRRHDETVSDSAESQKHLGVSVQQMTGCTHTAGFFNDRYLFLWGALVVQVNLRGFYLDLELFQMYSVCLSCVFFNTTPVRWSSGVKNTIFPSA